MEAPYSRSVSEKETIHFFNSAKKTDYFKNFFLKEWNDLKSLSMWRAALAEFLGVFLMVLFASGTSLQVPGGSSATGQINAALEAGFYIAVAVAIFGTISGGHVNPAISIGFVLTREITIVRFIIYAIAQTVGGIAGSAFLKSITHETLHEGSFGFISPGPGVSNEQALVCEITITFFLLFGTFALIDPGRTDLHGSIPLMIGIIVSVGVFYGYNISGGCMNPARQFGPAVVAGQLDKTWIYWVGPMLGGATGALLYDKVFSTKVCKTVLGGCISGAESTDDGEGETKENEDQVEKTDAV